MEKIKCTVETWSKKRQSFELKSLCGRLALPATAAHSEFFLTKVKRFSEFYFTAKFPSFKLKMRFRMAGEDKISSRHFFCPPLNLPEKIILAIIEAISKLLKIVKAPSSSI